MLKNVKIPTRTGTWYEIGDGYYKGERVYLMENDVYGGEAEWVLVNGKW